MRKLVVLFLIILSACTPTALNTPQPSDVSAIDQCSPSNPSVENWITGTTPSEMVSLSAFQVAMDLYSNPSSTGRAEALDWQQRTLQAYQFMKEYESIPDCLTTYHNLVTEQLYQLSLFFSEIELAYIAIDADQDYETYLNKAQQYLTAAHEASKSSVEEWSKFEELSALPKTSGDSISTLNLTSVSPSNISCDKDFATAFLRNADSTMKTVNQLAVDFGQTQNREQAEVIVDELDQLFQETFIWEATDCTKEVHTNLLLAIENLISAQRALLNGDSNQFNTEYEQYEYALHLLNEEAEKLEELVK